MENVTSLLIYMISFGISMIICNKYQSICKKNSYVELPIIKKTIWLLLIIAAPVFISAVRFDVGTDYFPYIEIYKAINFGSFDLAWLLYGKEPLFFWLNKIAFYLFDDTWGIFFLSSFLINIFIVIGIDYFKKDLSMAMALFLYYMILFNFGLNGIRFTIAAAIVFFAFRYIHMKRFFHYLAFIIIATMFHNTAILCLLFYLLANQKRRLNSQIRNFIFYFGIIFTPVIIVYFINSFMGFSFFSSYLKYVEVTQTTAGIGFLLTVIPVLVPIFLLKKQILAKNESYDLFLNLALLNVPFQYIAYYIPWGDRMVLYTSTVYVILVPFVISSINKKGNRLVVEYYFLIYFIIMYMLTYVIRNSSGGFPYSSIFF